MHCKSCEAPVEGEDLICAECDAMGVMRLHCDNCGVATGQWGFPDGDEFCDNCLATERDCLAAERG